MTDGPGRQPTNGPVHGPVDPSDAPEDALAARAPGASGTDADTRRGPGRHGSSGRTRHAGRSPDLGRPLQRSDLPADLTPDTLAHVELRWLMRLARPDNGVLTPAEQEQFDAALPEVMSRWRSRLARRAEAAGWQQVMQDAQATGGRADRRLQQHMRRTMRQLEGQANLAETLAPDLDWSFLRSGSGRPPAGTAGSRSTTGPGRTATPGVAASDAPQPPTGSRKGSTTASGSTGVAAPADADTDTDTDTDTDADVDADATLDEMEDQLGDQMDLLSVMTELASVSRRTYDLETQRDLASTRSTFFGFIVSVTVLVAGWAPLVMAEDWTQRWWIIGLTAATCVLAGLVYLLVMQRQRREAAAREAGREQAS